MHAEMAQFAIPDCRSSKQQDSHSNPREEQQTMARVACADWACAGTSSDVTARTPADTQQYYQRLQHKDVMIYNVVDHSVAEACHFGMVAIDI